MIYLHGFVVQRLNVSNFSVTQKNDVKISHYLTPDKQRCDLKRCGITCIKTQSLADTYSRSKKPVSPLTLQHARLKLSPWVHCWHNAQREFSSTSILDRMGFEEIVFSYGFVFLLIYCSHFTFYESFIDFCSFPWAFHIVTLCFLVEREALKSLKWVSKWNIYHMITYDVRVI